MTRKALIEKIARDTAATTGLTLSRARASVRRLTRRMTMAELLAWA